MAAKASFFFVFLCLLIVCCSAIYVSFSFDAKKHKELIQPAVDVVSLVQTRVSSSGTSDMSYHLCFSLQELLEVHKSGVSTFSLLKSKFQSIPTHINITSIVVAVSSDENLHPLILPTLQSIHSTLMGLNLKQKVKVAPMFPISIMKTLRKSHLESTEMLLNFVRASESFLVVEVPVDGTVLSGDYFDLFELQRVLSDLGMSMILKIRVVGIAMFASKVEELLESFTQVKIRIHGIYIEISCVGEFEERKHTEKQQSIYSRRVLLDHNGRSKIAIKPTQHDLITPVTNPITTPSTSSSGLVTVPSTDLVTVLPTNPTIPGITVPSSNPATTPITIPAMNPTTPITIPSSIPTQPPPQSVVPVTNPVTTPSNNSPLPPSNTGSTLSPSSLGQIWCVAKNGVSDTALQSALDFACGVGGVDCSPIQQTGSCYKPDTLHDHASYAFNSYYQKNPTPASCDFGGAATLVNSNPIACTTTATTPVAIPTTNGPTPITVPSTVPQPTVGTPITTPVTTPTVALPPPNVSPLTNPLPPPSGIPGGMVPGTIPVSSGNSGQTWCVAKTDASDAALRSAVDYACGMGGADCSAIQQSGSCYNPNTLHDHASYAFNSYYQKNPTPASCDFGGSATLVNTNPSSGTCTYPASSSTSPVLNSGAAPGGGSTTVFGSNSPLSSSNPVGSESPTTTSNSFHLFVFGGRPLLLVLLTTLFAL